jgi:hypothetical protein
MTKPIAIEDFDLNDERVAFVEAKPGGWAGTITVAAFTKALDDAGVPEELWPSAPSANKCLQRAMDAMKHNRRTLVRPLPKSKGWSLVYEDAEELELKDSYDNARIKQSAHSVDLTCRVKKVNDTDYVECTPWDHPLAPAVKQAFEQWQDNFKCSQDLSIWFSQTVVPWCNGVATRARGGSYYILKGESLERMVKVSKALDSVSHCYTVPKTVGGTEISITHVEQGGRVILKPEVASTAAVEILLENFLNECDNVCDTVGAKIEHGNLGHRALNTQQKVATEQAEKLKLFESVLDTRLDDIRERLEEAESNAGLAALQALED